MTRISRNKLIALVSAAAAVGSLTLFAQNASANTTTRLMLCTGSRGHVMDCCQSEIRDHRPLWMIEAHASCHDVVVCKKQGNYAGAAVDRCNVREILKINETRDHNTGTKRGN